MTRTFFLLIAAMGVLLLCVGDSKVAHARGTDYRELPYPRTMRGWSHQGANNNDDSAIQLIVVAPDGSTFAANSSHVIAVSVSGKLLWAQNFTATKRGDEEGVPVHTFAVVGAHLLVHTHEQFVAVSVADGSVAWRALPPAGQKWRSHTAIIPADGKHAYTVSTNDQITRINLADGSAVVAYDSSSPVDYQPLETTVPEWGIIIPYEHSLTLINASGLVASSSTQEKNVSTGAVFEGFYFTYGTREPQIFFANNLTLFNTVVAEGLSAVKKLIFWKNETGVFALFARSDTDIRLSLTVFDVLAKKKVEREAGVGWLRKDSVRSSASSEYNGEGYVWLLGGSKECSYGGGEDGITLIRLGPKTLEVAERGLWCGFIYKPTSGGAFARLNVHDGTPVVTADDRAVVAFNPQTLNVSYFADTSITVSTWNPVYFGGTIVHGTKGGDLHTLIPINNKTLTSKHPFPTTDLGERVDTEYYSPLARTSVVHEGDVSFFGVFCTFYAISPSNGTILWTASATYTSLAETFVGTPHIFKGNVYASVVSGTSGNRAVYVFDAATGSQQARIKDFGVGTVLSDDDYIYATCVKHLCKIDPKTFNVTRSKHAWVNSLSTPTIGGGLADYGFTQGGGMLYVMDKDRTVYGVAKADFDTAKKPTFATEFQLPKSESRLPSPLLLYDGLLWTGGSNKLYTIFASGNQTKAPLWIFDVVGELSRQSVFEFSGFVHVTTDNGVLYRFAPSGSRTPLATLKVDNSSENSGLGTPHISDAGVFVFTNANGVFVVDYRNGISNLWNFTNVNNDPSVAWSAPYVYDGIVYALGGARFYLLDLNTGAFWMRSGRVGDKYSVAYDKGTIFYVLNFVPWCSTRPCFFYENLFRSFDIVSRNEEKKQKFALDVNAAAQTKPVRFGRA